MNARTTSDISIRSVTGSVIATVPIRKESKRIWKLQTADYIELRFDLQEPIFIGVGSYIDDELFGRFVLCEEQSCTVDNRNGAYQYTIQFLNRYWQLNNFVFCFAHVVENTVDEYYRKETDWSLTDTLEAQLEEVCKNIESLGFSGYSFVVHEEDIESAGEAFLMQYSGTHIIDALTAIATQWECEWWAEVDSDTVVFHFGKCKHGEEPYIMEMGTTCEMIMPDKSSTPHANRIWAFGGTQNVPPSYKRHLWIEVLHKEVHNSFGTLYWMYDSNSSVQRGIEEEFINKDKLETDAPYNKNFDSGLRKTLTAQNKTADNQILKIYNSIIDPVYEFGDPEEGYEPGNTIRMVKGYHYDVNFQTNIGFKASFRDAALARLLNQDFTIYHTTVLWAVTTDEEDNSRAYIVAQNTKSHAFIFNRDERMGAADFTNEEGSPILDYIAGNQAELVSSGNATEEYEYNSFADGGSMQTLRNKEYRCESDGLYQFRVEHIFSIYYGTGVSLNSVQWKENVTITGYAQTSGSVKQGGYRYYVDVTDEQGESYKIIFNPTQVSRDAYSSETDMDAYYAFRILKDGVAQEDIPLNTRFLIDDDDLTTAVDDSYFTYDIDDPAALKRIGERRIDLPSEYEDDKLEIVNGYMQVKGTTDRNAIEDAIVLDDVFPKLLMQVGAVECEEKREEISYSDGSIYHWPYLQYTITPNSFFPIKQSWLLDGAKLQIKFLTRADALGIDSNFEENGAEYKLAGMTFDVTLIDDEVWNAEEQGYNSIYRVERNEAYGAKLPGETLHPSKGDPFILIGWNTKEMSRTGLVEKAEKEVAERTAEYLRAIMEKQYTYTCEIMSNALLNEDGTFNLLAHGQSVRVNYTPLSTAVPFVDCDGNKIYTKDDELFCVRNISQESRIIGYELKLDIPYDTPRYTVGESEAYSRLKNIEKQITKLN